MAELHFSIPLSDNRIVRIGRERHAQLLAEREALRLEVDALKTQNSLLRSRIAVDDEQLALADMMLSHYNPQLSLLGPWPERFA